MPKVYSSNDATLDKQYKTRLLAPVGEKTIFPLKDETITLGQITQHHGTSNTIAFLEALPDKSVIWTKPDDLDWLPNEPKKGLVQELKDSFLAVACDGTVHQLDNMPDKIMISFFDWKSSDATELMSLGRRRSTGRNFLGYSLVEPCFDTPVP